MPRAHLPSIRRLVFAACLLALCLPASAWALPSGFFGIESKDAAFGTGAYRVSQFQRQSQAGVGLLRQFFDWSSIEKTRGQFSFGAYDSIVGDAARSGLQVLPIVHRSPGFYSGQPSGSAGDWHASNPSDIGGVLRALVGRYGPNGSFWAANPSIPKRPIRAWQIWNEPHLPGFWGPNGPSPAQYTQLLCAAHAAVKGADSGAEVVAAGISQSTLQGAIPLNTFVNGIYDAGGKGCFEDLAVHPYANQVSQAVGLVRGVRSIMDAHGDGSGIWVTEFGWASGGPASDYTTDEAGQAARVGQFMSQLVSQQGALNIRGLVLYNWKDSTVPNWDDWSLHTGLTRLDGSAKPALAAYSAVAKSAPGTPGPGPGPSPGPGTPPGSGSGSPPSGGGTGAGDGGSTLGGAGTTLDATVVRGALRNVLAGLARGVRTLAHRHAHAARTSRPSAVFKAPAAGRLTVTLRTRGRHSRLLASGHVTTSRAVHRRLRLRILRHGLTRLRHARAAVLTATFVDGAGTRTVVRRTVKLR